MVMAMGANPSDENAAASSGGGGRIAAIPDDETVVAGSGVPEKVVLLGLLVQPTGAPAPPKKILSRVGANFHDKCSWRGPSPPSMKTGRNCLSPEF
jgi:hypothetical protein